MLFAGCAAPGLPQKPQSKDKDAVWRGAVVSGTYPDNPAQSAGGSASAAAVMPPQQSTNPPPMIRRHPHRRPADVDMGPDADDDDAPDQPDAAPDQEPKPSTATAASPQPQPEADPEPAGPLIHRKHQGDEAQAPDASVDVKDIKALPTTENGHVKFPPPPEDQADEDELEVAVKAKKTKMAAPGNLNVDVAPADAMTLDPASLGSYHVEVSTSPRFRPVFLDNVYGFGTDIKLEDDVDAAGGKTGKYYIRWALIDLLDMEHPFHKTKYFLFISQSESSPNP